MRRDISSGAVRCASAVAAADESVMTAVAVPQPNIAFFVCFPEFPDKNLANIRNVTAAPTAHKAAITYSDTDAMTMRSLKQFIPRAVK